MFESEVKQMGTYDLAKGGDVRGVIRSEGWHQFDSNLVKGPSAKWQDARRDVLRPGQMVSI